MIHDVMVIGGGAAGLMAAVVAAERGKKVFLLEKNRELGAKLKITGGGRCNITNAELDIHALLKNYGQVAPFLYSPFSEFGVKETFDFFESRGLPLVEQANKRAFPKSERAADVVNLFKREITRARVDVKTNCAVTKILHAKGRVTEVLTSQGEFKARSFILATGGVSHPTTGSTGDGFKWLKELGHEIKPPTPTIVPLAVKEAWVKSLAGVSLNNVKITFYLEDKKQFAKTGRILFTHFGLSGPLILNSAIEVDQLLQSGKVTARIDLFPKLDLGALDQQIVVLFNESKNKSLKNVVKDLAPAALTQALALLAPQLNFETKVHSVSKEDRKQLGNFLKALPLTITNLMGFDRAVVADGGVPLEQVDMKTMRSKLYENLYIVGDLLHINRPSGGYSLQLCWTSGFVAAQAVK